MLTATARTIATVGEGALRNRPKSSTAGNPSDPSRWSRRFRIQAAKALPATAATDASAVQRPAACAGIPVSVVSSVGGSAMPPTSKNVNAPKPQASATARGVSTLRSPPAPPAFADPAGHERCVVTIAIHDTRPAAPPIADAMRHPNAAPIAAAPSEPSAKPTGKKVLQSVRASA